MILIQIVPKPRQPLRLSIKYPNPNLRYFGEPIFAQTRGQKWFLNSNKGLLIFGIFQTLILNQLLSYIPNRIPLPPPSSPRQIGQFVPPPKNQTCCWSCPPICLSLHLDYWSSLSIRAMLSTISDSSRAAFSVTLDGEWLISLMTPSMRN